MLAASEGLAEEGLEALLDDLAVCIAAEAGDGRVAQDVQVVASGVWTASMKEPCFRPSTRKPVTPGEWSRWWLLSAVSA